MLFLIVLGVVIFLCSCTFLALANNAITFTEYDDARFKDNIVIFFTANDDRGVFIFRIDGKSKLENCCGEEIAIEDLSKGVMVNINYHKYIFEKEKVHTVKTKIYEQASTKNQSKAQSICTYIY